MGNVIRLSESELIEMISKTINLHEQMTGGNTTGQDDKLTSQLIDVTKKLRGGLFKTGSDQIDTNSSEFQKAVKELKTVGDVGNPVEIVGGASSVGSDRGFNNKGLATRRAMNFKTALRDAGVNTSKMFVTDVIVGSATERNSPDAIDQQYVGYIVRDTNYKVDYQTAIDNTATVKQDIKKPLNLVQTKPQPKKSPQGNYTTFNIFYDTKSTNINKITQMVLSALDGKPGIKKIQGL